MLKLPFGEGMILFSITKTGQRMDIELLEWLRIAVIAPVVGVFGTWLRRRVSASAAAKRREKALIARLVGLPAESKAVLVDLHIDGTQTFRGDPVHPGIAVLVNARILTEGPAGSYAAVDRYFTVRPEIWELTEEWVVVDPFAAREVAVASGVDAAP